MLTREENIEVSNLAHAQENLIESSSVFENASQVDQIEILDDLIDALQRWRDMIYDKLDNDSD